MKCFVVTKKHIAVLLAAAILIPLSAVLIKSYKNRAAVSVFKPSSSEILSEALPSTGGVSVIDKIKEFISSEKNKKPKEIVSEFAPYFAVPSESAPIQTQDVTPTPQITAAPEVSTEPVQTEETVPIEEKVNTAKEPTILKNDTSYEVNAEEFINEPLSFPKTAEVLIMHTHTTESFAPENSDNAYTNDNSRSVDELQNIVAVGEVISRQLQSMGIKVTHDKTVHDYPSYQGAYGRSLSTVKNDLGENKNICIVIDLHRDAIAKSDGTRVKLCAEINGAKCAQIMIVCGTNDGGLAHTDWQKNFAFAAKIQRKASELYPNLMRPINLRAERFNQHLTSGSLILEVGTNGNTLSEAKNGAALAADALGKVILENLAN